MMLAASDPRGERQRAKGLVALTPQMTSRTGQKRSDRKACMKEEDRT